MFDIITFGSATRDIFLRPKRYHILNRKKFITGKGNAPKEFMLMEVYKRFNEEFRDNNICDAYCLARVGDMIINPNDQLLSYQQEVINKLIEK